MKQLFTLFNNKRKPCVINRRAAPRPLFINSLNVPKEREREGERYFEGTGVTEKPVLTLSLPKDQLPPPRPKIASNPDVGRAAAASAGAVRPQRTEDRRKQEEGA